MTDRSLSPAAALVVPPRWAPDSVDLSTVCLACDTPMRPEHAHYRCPACGWRDSCCDGPY